MRASHSLEWRPRHPTDLRQTLGSLRRGPGDPAFLAEPGGAIWRTTRTPEGPATLRLTQPAADVLRCEAWGPGAALAVAQAPELAGDRDDPAAFDPRLDLLADAHRRNPGMRIPRTAAVFEALVPAILEQKIITLQAHASWRRLVQRFGEPAPGPVPRQMFVVPDAETWATLPTWEWHRANVDPKRARTIVNAARFAARIDEAAQLTNEAAAARLMLFPGIGPWTAAEVAQRALGDTDAVSVGDFHLAKQVGHALYGHDITDDEMLEALEPWAGQRYRVVRLLLAAGALRRPRRGPRLAFVDHRAH